MADGTLEYDVLADTKGFTGPLSLANSTIGKMGVGLGALIGPAAALAGVAGGIAGIGKALGNAANLESTQVAFRTLVGDVERADGALRKIKELGASTPFEFPELADAGRKLIAFGQSAEQVPGTLSMIGDIASGVQAPIGDIAEIFGKAQVAGTLYAEDINQLVGRGIPVIQEFARQLGVSEGEVKKMAAEGKISFPMLQKAFGDLTAEGGKFHNMMAAQAGTTTGLMSTLRDGINDIFTTLGTPINDALKPLLQGAIAMVSKVGEGLQKAVAVGQAAFAQGKLGELLSMMLKLGAIEAINFLGGGLIRAVVAGAEAFVDLNMAAATAMVNMLQSGFRFVARLFAGDFNSVISGFATRFSNVVNGLSLILGAKIGGVLQKVAAHFQAGLIYAVQGLMTAVGKIPGIGKALGLENFKGASFSDLVTQMMGKDSTGAILAKGQELLNSGLGDMTGGLSDKIAEATEWIGNAGSEIGAAISRAADGGDLIEGADDLRGKITGLVDSLSPEPLKEAVEGASAAITAPIADAVSSPGSAPMAADGGAASSASTDQAKKKIRLYGLVDSEQRRLDRMSDVDKAKYAAGTRVGALNASPSLLATAAAGAPPAMDPPPRRGAAAETARKGPESQLLEVLREIAGNTAPMKSLSAA